MASERRSSVERDLFIAAKCGDVDGVVTALDGGAPIEAVDRDRYTVLMQAVACEKLPVVRLLLERGANVRGHWIDGASALHFSARGGSTEITGLLLDHGADPNRIGGGRFGGPPLLYALRADRGDQARYLLGRGATIVDIPDHDEWLEEALAEGRDSAARVLLEEGLRLASDSPLWDDARVLRLLESAGVAKPGKPEPPDGSGECRPRPAFEDVAASPVDQDSP